MRLLAVRGANLASLSGPFEVDFEAPPLADTGLFAITGPTGVGKSTLLDAVCLALYDQIPRILDVEAGAAIADGAGTSLAQRDVRAILRHGTAGGHAEVDFVGQDGVTYRARWAVRRARDRAEGRLQAQTVTLSRRDSGERIGDKKTDTLAEIRHRVGLDFDQFRRSVLLAQGEFDTFIRARPDERAELLERLTGTQVYGDISQAAYGRAKNANAAVKALELRLGEHVPMAEDARRDAEAELAARHAAAKDAEGAHARLAKAQHWFAEERRLAARVTEAQDLLSQAQQANAEATETRQTIARAEAAFAVRAEVSAAHTATRERDDLSLSVNSLTNDIKVAHEKSTAAEDALSRATEALAATRSDYRAAGPALDAAKDLDTRLATAADDLARRQAALATAQMERRAAEAALAALAEERADLAAAIGTHAAWLASNEHLAPLAGQAQYLRERLGDAGRLHGECADIERQLDAARSAARQAEEAHEDARRTAAEREANIGREEDAATRLRAGLADCDRDGLAARKESLTAAAAALSGLMRAHRDARALKDEAAANAGAQAEAEARRRAAQEDAASAKPHLPLALERLKEARRGLDLSEAAAGEQAAALRARLVEGSPCPVCGAIDHPAGSDNPLAERLEKDRARVEELEAAQAEVRARIERAETTSQAADNRLAELRTAAAALTGREETIGRDWEDGRAAMAGHGFAIDATAPHAADEKALAALAATITEENQELVERLKVLNDQAGRLRAHEETLAALRGEYETARRRLAEAAETLARQRHQIEGLSGRATSRGQDFEVTCERIAPLLDGVVADWRSRLTTDHSALATDCAALAARWRDTEKALADAQSQAAELGTRAAGAQARGDAAAAKATEAAEAHKAAGVTIETLRRQRAEIFDGHPVEAVREHHEQAIEAAAKAEAEARDARDQARQTLSGLGARLEAAQAALGKASRQAQEAEQVLAARLEAAGLERQDVEAALACGEDWWKEQRSHVDRLAEAESSARATFADRQAQHQAHCAEQHPEDDSATIDMQLAAAAAALEEAREAHAGTRQVLATDDEKRRQAAALQEELDAARADQALWGRLNDLIGSADGAKFRRYAQSLTLGHLVGLANAHLGDLAPRYVLEQAPGSELVLQVVDRDMGAQVRGVHNLSGGERFLVSLALALALASMSSGRGTRVDSLFIDEGFGALDQASLGQAISALEALQATGRRIGVISHVSALHERLAVKIDLAPEGGGRSALRITRE